jgi:hypothetical protein
MCIVEAAIGGAGAIAGGLIGAGGAKSAAKAQSKAAGKAADVSQEQYYQTREDQMPFLEAGYGALARQNELLGLGPQFDQSFNNFNAGAYLNANPDAKAWVAQHANKSGSNAEQLAYDHWVADGSRRQGDFWRNQTPSADYGKYARDFSMKDFTTDPGYAFRMSEGLKSLDRQAAARGGLISGGALKAAQRYGQDLGSQEYQNAFNRYQVNRANQLTPLQSMSGMGQTTATQLGNAGQNYAGQAGAAYGAAGQAAASGYMGMANAISGGIGQYLNYQSNNSLINALNRPGSGGGGGGGGSYVPADYGFGTGVRFGTGL